jgi:predicted secreted protein
MKLAQDGILWWAVLNIILPLGSIKVGGISTFRTDCATVELVLF